MSHYLFAYLDAGSGSLILQMIIGGVAGLSALVRFKWQALKDRHAGGLADRGDEGPSPSNSVD